MYVDDPSQMIQAVEQSWIGYLAAGETMAPGLEALVVQWKQAKDVEYLPNHPLWKTVDTKSEGFTWSPRQIKWIHGAVGDASLVQHGFDADDRLIFVRNVKRAWCIIYGDGYHDIVVARQAEGSKQWTNSREVRDGDGRAGFVRLYTDNSGRIVTRVEMVDEGLEQSMHYRRLDVYCWEGDRVVESFQHRYKCDDSIPGWAKENLSPQQQANMYRRINDSLFESGRTHVKFQYSSEGKLVQADKFTEDGRRTETLFAVNPSDTIESLQNELVSMLAPAIVRTLKAVGARPIDRVALIYSAEHAHCGLPSGILVHGANDSPGNPLDWESYPHTAQWPPQGSVGEKIERLQTRLLNLVEADPAFADDFQPRPYREVLWRVSREIHNKLAKKWFSITSNNFAIFPLDDHGDVDPEEDVRQCMSNEESRKLLESLS